MVRKANKSGRRKHSSLPLFALLEEEDLTGSLTALADVKKRTKRATSCRYERRVHRSFL
jgi:hypothetical protein